MNSKNAAIMPPDERRFDRGAWLVLGFALLFIALDFAQLAYRFTLPTEGWIIDESKLGPDAHDFPMSRNVVGAPSPLQPGDALHIIGGIFSDQILNTDSLTTVLQPAGWESSGEVAVTVLRAGQTLTFDIPIVHWTFAAWLRSNFTDLTSLTKWLSALILLGIGFFTFLKRPGNFAARFLFLFSLAWSATLTSNSLPDTVGVYFNLPAVLSKALFSNVIFAYMFGPSLLGFALTFPRPKAFIQRRPGWLAAPYLAGAITLVLLFTAPKLTLIGFPLTLAMILASMAALIHSGLTMRDTVSRAQLRWAVGGVVLGLAMFTLNYWASFLPSPISNVLLAIAVCGPLVMGLSLAIAILRYRLFDIDIIIRKTLVYAVLTALLAAIYFGGVVLLEQLTRSITETSDLAIVVSTLVIAALFFPLRRRVQNVIDRRFYRSRYDAAKTLAAFSDTVRDEVELEKLTEELLNVVGETIQPTSVSLWLVPPRNEHHQTEGQWTSS